MTRRVLTDGIWAQLQAIMAAKGCYDAGHGLHRLLDDLG